MTTAGRVRSAVCLVAFAALATTGCGSVNRRFVVESNVPNAQVYIDNKPIGPAPAHAAFEYYGYYTITLVQPGYETQTRRVHVVAPWYAYPPFDFLAVMWPFGVEDVRRYDFELCPVKPTRTDELIQNADALRERGWALPQPEHPAQPAGGTLGAPVPANPNPTPQPLPPPTPGPPPKQPGPSPLIPSVTPTGGTAPR